jgi:hypothetical protein
VEYRMGRLGNYASSQETGLEETDPTGPAWKASLEDRAARFFYFISH